jgi:hypothetical protein
MYHTVMHNPTRDAWHNWLQMNNSQLQQYLSANHAIQQVQKHQTGPSNYAPELCELARLQPPHAQHQQTCTMPTNVMHTTPLDLQQGCRKLSRDLRNSIQSCQWRSATTQVKHGGICSASNTTGIDGDIRRPLPGVDTSNNIRGQGDTVHSRALSVCSCQVLVCLACDPQELTGTPQPASITKAGTCKGRKVILYHAVYMNDLNVPNS